MAKTIHALVNEVSRDFQLGLSNGEFHALADALGGEGEATDYTSRLLYGLGPDGIRRTIKEQRAAVPLPGQRS